MAHATCQTKKTETEKHDAANGRRPAEPRPRPRPETRPRRRTAGPRAWLGDHEPTGGLSPADFAADRAAGGRAAVLADEWVRRAAAAAVAAELQADGYDGLSFHSVARRAGLSSDDVRRVFPSKAEMVLKVRRDHRRSLPSVLGDRR